jgi:hypothetical protein
VARTLLREPTRMCEDQHKDPGVYVTPTVHCASVVPRWLVLAVLGKHARTSRTAGSLMASPDHPPTSVTLSGVMRKPFPVAVTVHSTPASSTLQVNGPTVLAWPGERSGIGSPRFPS